MHFKRKAGSDFSLDFYSEFEAGVTLAGVQIISSIARKAGETPVLVKKNQAAGGADIQVSATVSGQTIEGSAYYTAADCRGLHGEYEWDIVAKTTDNFEVVLASGTIGFDPRVTRTF